jgi:hypothetical protein
MFQKHVADGFVLIAPAFVVDDVSAVVLFCAYLLKTAPSSGSSPSTAWQDRTAKTVK